MSRAPHEAINVPDAAFDAQIGVDQYPPQSTPNQASHGVSNFVDGSGPIFSMYLETATEEDKKMVENWKADADGILIYTGLFSASVASLISVSIQDIRPNPQDTSNFYLENIYRTAADPNRSNILPSSPPPFSPPTYAIWVNSFWFLSLVISLTCALLATLLQQWARRYLRVTQPRYSLHKRARIRAFFAEGFERFLLPRAVEALPTLLHISLFLFFAGLVVFLCNINLTIFKLVLSWVGVCTALYGCITFMPIFRHDCPYYTPLSLPAWHMITKISYVIVRILRRLTRSNLFSSDTFDHFQSLEEWYYKVIVQGMEKVAEEIALDSPSEIDNRALMWTFDTLDEDHELERFFTGLPDFRSSKVVDDPLLSLAEGQKQKLSTALMGLLSRTFSSDLLPEPVKRRRAIICAKAIDPAHTPRALGIFDMILSYYYQNSGLLPTEFLQIVKGWGDDRRVLVTQAIVSSIVARARQRDESWFILAAEELDVSDTVLRDYGDNLSLAILIHITRQQFNHLSKRTWHGWPWVEFSKVIEAASKSVAQDPSPVWQRKFCALWNQIVLKARNDNDRWMASAILGRVRNVYVALHQGADSAPTILLTPYDPTSYPLCNNVFGRHPDPTPHIHDDSASTTSARAGLHDNAALVPASLASPDAPSSSVPTSLHVDESLTDVPPLDDDIYVAGSFHPGFQTPIENFRVPAIPVTACVIQGDIGTSTTTLPLSTPEPSAPTLPPTTTASTSPPGAVAVQHIPPADRWTSSDVTGIPSLPSPTLAIMPPTESHSALPTPAVHGPSCPRPSSAPDVGASAEGEGSAKAASHQGRESLDPPLVIQENTMAVPDLPPPSPSSVYEITTAGPSLREPDSEGTGKNPPHPSKSWHDFV